MEIIIFLFLIPNIIGCYLYGGWIYVGVSHKKQMIVDFLCPFGAILGRLLFKFDMGVNKFAYIYGAIVEVILFIIATVLYF